MAIHSKIQEVQFLSSDIDLFWEVLEKSPTPFDANYFEKNYFLAGSPYLKGIFIKRIKQAKQLTDLLNSPEGNAYFRSVENNTKNFDQERNAIFQALKTFQQYFPPCRFCDIAFVIGALSTGGIIHQDTIVIGLELFAKAEDSKTTSFHPWVQSVSRSLDYLPAIVIHELVHVQQAHFLKNKKHQVQLSRLLDLCIMEGTADFVCALILKNKFPHDLLHPIANPKEAQIWEAFQQDMLKQETGKWLYKKLTGKDEISNLGYYVGYKIVEQYYHQNGASQKALQDIIELKDPLALLAASAYGNKF